MRGKCTLAAIVVSLLAGLSPLTADSVIQRGIDTFVTTADGTTFIDFAHNPVPAGFFCKASRTFTGKVALKGLPIETGVPGQLGAADTIVERLDDAVFDAKGVASTRLQFRALSMVSIAPVKTACGAHHLYVSLARQQPVTTMTIHRTQEDGGTFVAPLAIAARLTFIPVKPARTKGARKLEMAGSINFPAIPLPWSLGNASAKRLDSVVVDTDGDLKPDTPVPGHSNFLAGLSPNARRTKGGEGHCVCYMVCHDNDGEQHCTWTWDGFCMEPPC